MALGKLLCHSETDGLDRTEPSLDCRPKIIFHLWLCKKFSYILKGRWFHAEIATILQEKEED